MEKMTIFAHKNTRNKTNSQSNLKSPWYDSCHNNFTSNNWKKTNKQIEFAYVS